VGRRNLSGDAAPSGRPMFTRAGTAGTRCFASVIVLPVIAHRPVPTHPRTAIGARQRGSLAARAQQGDRAWRIGVLLAGDENDPMAKPRISAFTHALAELGWVDGTKRADGPSLGRHRQQSDRSARGRVGRPARHHLGKLGPGDRCRPAGEADAGPASVFMLEGIPRSARFIAPSPQTRP
jgi:hypothetical protein